MSKIYNVAEARAHFSELIDRAAASEEIVIAKAGKPIVRLAPVTLEPRRPGSATHWKIPTGLFLEPMSDDELDIAEGSLNDDWCKSVPTEEKK
jgi:prevent-host-death family protein